VSWRIYKWRKHPNLGSPNISFHRYINSLKFLSYLQDINQKSLEYKICKEKHSLEIPVVYQPKIQSRRGHVTRASDISDPKEQKKKNKIIYIYETQHKNSAWRKDNYHFVFITRNKRISGKLPTLKLAHFTKQNGQEKSSVTAS